MHVGRLVCEGLQNEDEGEVAQDTGFGISMYQALASTGRRPVLNLTSRHAGPETRITAIAALPAAVDRA